MCAVCAGGPDPWCGPSRLWGHLCSLCDQNTGSGAESALRWGSCGELWDEVRSSNPLQPFLELAARVCDYLREVRTAEENPVAAVGSD